MKLVSYAVGDDLRPGIVCGHTVYDLPQLLAHKGGEATPVRSVREFLAAHGGRLAELTAPLAAAAEANPDAAIGAFDTVRLGPPVPDSAKILCIGLNYRDHVEETGKALPTAPEIFPKFDSTLIGPNDDIRCSAVSDNLDFEGELAVVIGRECRNVSGSEALDAVAGLMVLNDITARDLQYRGTQFLPGKAVDGSTPCGPALVTLDEVGDPHSLEIVTRVNGVEMQHSNTKHLIFRIEDLVADISRFLTLSPGDIISTGTPGGVGAKQQPALYLKPGDKVEVEVERVGVLQNVIA